MGEHADGVGVAAHHHVGETNIVVCGEVGSHDAGELGLLVELNVIECLECKTEVTQQAVHTQEPNNGEVTQHLVQGALTVLASVEVGVFTALHGCELLVDLRSLDERVQNIENTVATPCVGVLAQKLDFLLVVIFQSDLLTVAAETVELVNELVDDVPCPVVLSFMSAVPPYLAEPIVLTLGTSRSTGPSELRM